MAQKKYVLNIDENKYLGAISSAKNSSYNYEDVVK